MGFVLRLPFYPLTGFEQDFHDFATWAEYCVEHGAVSIYDNPEANLPNGFVNYPPVYLYMLSGLGRVHALAVSSDLHTALFGFMKKAWTGVFEALVGLALYAWLRRRYGHGPALWGSGLFFLNPGIIYLSAYYGQVDVIFGAFLLFAFMALIENRPGMGGALLAAALWTKIQTLPFIPLFFLYLLFRREGRGLAYGALGFVAGSAVILLPYLVTGRVDDMFDHSVIFNLGLGTMLSQGAFNLWFLHLDPSTFDQRIWGWLYGSGGQVETFLGLGLLTYKRLGVVFFFLAYAWLVWLLYREPKPWRLLTVAGLAGAVFFMLPTTVHERYLFPFFLFYAPLAALTVGRRWFLGFFSLTYLLNLIFVCPLLGASPALENLPGPVTTLIAAFNVAAFILLLGYEWQRSRQARFNGRAWSGAAAGLVIALFLARSLTDQPPPQVLYLSHIQPAASEQDWPLIPPELTDPPPGYQVGMDRSSSGRPLQIRQTRFRYGLGAHANSRIEYVVPPGYGVFESWIGLDAANRQAFLQQPNRGKARFRVYVNDQLAYESPPMVPSMPPRHVLVRMPPSQSNRLSLRVDDAGDGIEFDHANWALARLIETNP